MSESLGTAHRLSRQSAEVGVGFAVDGKATRHWKAGVRCGFLCLRPSIVDANGDLGTNNRAGGLTINGEGMWRRWDFTTNFNDFNYDQRDGRRLLLSLSQYGRTVQPSP